MGIIYIAGRPISAIGKDGKGHDYAPGDEVDVTNIPHVEAFVNSGHLFKVFKGRNSEYSNLPPHIFSAVMTRKEAEGRLAEDAVEFSAQKEAAEAYENDLVRKISLAESEVASAVTSVVANDKGVLVRDTSKSDKSTDKARGIVESVMNETAKKRGEEEEKPSAPKPTPTRRTAKK